MGIQTIIQRIRVEAIWPSSGRFRLILAACLLSGLVLSVFLPARDFPFIEYDDQINVYENPLLLKLSSDSFHTFWRGAYNDIYAPLTYSYWGALVSIAGKAPGPRGTPIPYPHVFHLANIVLHTLNGVLVFAIAYVVTESLGGSLLGAMLFGVHPLAIEPVAWVTGAKDVLAGLWSFLGVLVILCIDQRDRVLNRANVLLLLAAGVSFVAAVFAKPTAASMPLAALGLILVRRTLGSSKQRNRLQAPDKGFKIAAILIGLVWLTATLGSLVITKAHQADALLDTTVAPLLRPFIALDALAFYVVKLISPWPLSIDYGRTPAAVQLSGMLWLSWLLPSGIFTVLCFCKGRRWTLPLAGAFLATLLPVLGLLPFGYQEISTVADRYIYPALMVAAVAVAALIQKLPRSALPMILFLAVLTWTSFQHLPAWSSSEELFSDTLIANPDSWFTHYAQAAHYDQAGRYDEAIQHYKDSVRLHPQYKQAHFDLARAYMKVDQQDMALREFQVVLDLAPGFPDALLAIGTILAQQRRYPESLRFLLKALEVRPDHPLVLFDVGVAYFNIGDFAHAASYLKRVIQLEPRYLEARMNLALALKAQADLAGAREQLLAVLSLDPDHVKARNMLSDLH